MILRSITIDNDRTKKLSNEAVFIKQPYIMQKVIILK